MLKNKAKLIGDIGIQFLTDNEQVEIGYTLDPGFQGWGYALEAVKAVIDYLFFDLMKHRITSSVDAYSGPPDQQFRSNPTSDSGLMRPPREVVLV